MLRAGNFPRASHAAKNVPARGENKDNRIVDIAKVLHQTWKDSESPDVFSGYVDSWKANHPDWEYRLWTDVDNRRFIARH